MAAIYYPRCLVVLEVLLEDFQNGADDAVHEIAMIPVSCEVNRNSFLEADDFRVTFDLRDLPVDPRVLRQVRVRIYLDGVRNPADRLKPKRSNAAFVGWMDEAKQSLDGSAEVVELTGRDYTSALLDHKWGPKAINLTRQLSDVVNSILDEVPGCAELPLFIDGPKATTILAKAFGKSKYTPKSSKDSAWQVLTDICALLALIPVVELDTLHIRAAGEFGQTASAFVYGENVSKLVLKRRVNDAKQKQVRVRCWDEAAREEREATFPKNPIILTKKISTTGKVTQTAAPIITHLLQGVFTVPELEAIAEQIFERAARQQLEGTLETKELESLANDKLVRVANGGSVDVKIQRGDRQRVAGLSDAEARRELTTGPNQLTPEVIDVLLAGRRRAEGLASRFYVQAAKHSWTRDDGYTLSIEFINFIGTEL